MKIISLGRNHHTRIWSGEVRAGWLIKKTIRVFSPDAEKWYFEPKPGEKAERRVPARWVSPLVEWAKRSNSWR